MNLASIINGAKTAIATNKAAKREADKAALSFMLTLALAVFAVMPEIAMAAPWDGAADKILEIFTGGLARTLAMIGIIACGVAALAGKLSWDWAIKIVIGIVLIFGSATIVDYIISAVGS